MHAYCFVCLIRKHKAHMEPYYISYIILRLALVHNHIKRLMLYCVILSIICRVNYHFVCCNEQTVSSSCHIWILPKHIYLYRKYEEICPPQVDEFCYITDNTYGRKEASSLCPWCCAHRIYTCIYTYIGQYVYIYLFKEVLD